MSSEEFEVGLLWEYADEAESAEDPKVRLQKIAVYERQLQHCKNQCYEFNVAFAESYVHYLRARHAILAQGRWERLNRSMASEASDLSTTMFTAFSARSSEMGRIDKAIDHLSDAIRLCDWSHYRLLRADLYHGRKNSRSALADLDHILRTQSADEEDYREARKLKDEVETKGTGGCLSSVLFVLGTAASVGVGISLLLS